MNKSLLITALGLFLASVTVTEKAGAETGLPAHDSTSEEERSDSDAPVTDDRYYLAPFGTFIKTGGDRNAQDGAGAGLGFGRVINAYLNIEIRGFWQGYQANGYPNYKESYKTLPWNHGSNNLQGGTVDFQYYFSRDTLAPYAVFGLGAMNTSYLGSLDWPPFDGDSAGTNVSFVFEAGAGLTYEVADNFLLRGDVRYRGDTAPSNFSGSEVAVVNDLLVNFGFVIPIGDKPGTVARN